MSGPHWRLRGRRPSSLASGGLGDEESKVAFDDPEPEASDPPG
jgi:hypothetical protein